ncbi:MAG: class I SAM-dependent methyltransferase [Haloferacaceae archaeon]
MDSTEVRRSWAERSGEYSPAYYAYHGPDERSEAVREVLDRHVDRDASVLEVGCSSGRHLSHLHEHGFGDLAGIEVNADAFDVMDETYPALAAAGTFYHGAVEDLVDDFADGRFDVVYSVETLQHIHPDTAWVFGELARIADDLLVTVENEGGDDRPEGTDAAVHYVSEDVPLYHRNWKRVFTEAGLVEAEASAGDRTTTRAFRCRD